MQRPNAVLLQHSNATLYCGVVMQVYQCIISFELSKCVAVKIFHGPFFPADILTDICQTSGLTCLFERLESFMGFVCTEIFCKTMGG